MQSKDVSLASNFKQIKDDIFPARVLEDLNTYYYFLVVLCIRRPPLATMTPSHCGDTANPITDCQDSISTFHIQ